MTGFAEDIPDSRAITVVTVLVQPLNGRTESEFGKRYTVGWIERSSMPYFQPCSDEELGKVLEF